MKINLLVISMSLTLMIGTPVLAESQPKISCDFKVVFSRSDEGVDFPYHQVIIRGEPEDTFQFDGCSAQYQTGQYCVSTYGIMSGARLLKNQTGEIVAEGNCCNSVQNKVLSISKECNYLPIQHTFIQPVDENDNSCWAIYSGGNLNIPCLKVTDPFGGDLKYEVNMRYQPLSDPMSFELIGAQPK